METVAALLDPVSSGSMESKGEPLTVHTPQRHLHVQDSSVPDPNTERAKHTQAMPALVQKMENVSIPG